MSKGTEGHFDTLPIGRLGLIPLNSSAALGKKVDDYLVSWRKGRGNEFAEKYVAAYEGYERDSYIIQSQVPRFGSGEAKGIINESVRGDDIYILLDVCNYSLTYSLCGYTNHMSPDDHFQDLKRVIAASGEKPAESMSLCHSCMRAASTRDLEESLSTAHLVYRS